jgi:hypothetical protein
MSNPVENTNDFLAHNDSAVQTHMQMYQSIISRMAGNSAAIKQWGLPFLTAVLAFVVKEQLYVLIWILVVGIFIFYFLDSYYLMLENRFRDGFNDDAALISSGQFPKSKLYKLVPGRVSGRDCWIKAVTSIATWPVYVGMLAMAIGAYKLVI